MYPRSKLWRLRHWVHVKNEVDQTYLVIQLGENLPTLPEEKFIFYLNEGDQDIIFHNS
jgi:hypothetical protein